MNARSLCREEKNGVIYKLEVRCPTCLCQLESPLLDKNHKFGYQYASIYTIRANKNVERGSHRRTPLEAPNQLLVFPKNNAELIRITTLHAPPLSETFLAKGIIQEVPINIVTNLFKIHFEDHCYSLP